MSLTFSTSFQNRFYEHFNGNGILTRHSCYFTFSSRCFFFFLGNKIGWFESNHFLESNKSGSELCGWFNAGELVSIKIVNCHSVAPTLNAPNLTLGTVEIELPWNRLHEQRQTASIATVTATSINNTKSTKRNPTAVKDVKLWFLFIEHKLLSSLQFLTHAFAWFFAGFRLKWNSTSHSLVLRMPISIEIVPVKCLEKVNWAIDWSCHWKDAERSKSHSVCSRTTLSCDFILD